MCPSGCWCGNMRWGEGDRRAKRTVAEFAGQKERVLAKSPKKKLRFGVGDGGRLYSEIWTLWNNRSDVYLTSKAFGGRIKLSLHQSGVCQYAFSKDFWEANSGVFESGFKDRTWHRWRRPYAAKDKLVHVATVIFASCEQWNDYDSVSNEAVALLTPPPHGYCFEVSIICSTDSYTAYSEPNAMGPLIEIELENGEYLTVWPVFSKLPSDYFDFRKIEGGIVEFGPVLAGKGDDVRGISVVHLTQLEGEPLRIHSSHNMRLVTVRNGEGPPIYRRSHHWWDIISKAKSAFGSIRLR